MGCGHRLYRSKLHLCPQYADGTPSADFKVDGQVTSLLLLPDGKWVAGTSDKFRGYGHGLGHGTVYVRNADGTPSTNFEVDRWSKISIASARW